jgi:transmembrane sensor
MNTPMDHISEELLARYFGNSATAEEVDQVLAWVEISPDHAQELEAFRIIWQAAESSGRRKKFDADSAWTKVRGKMESGSGSLDERPISFVSETKIKPLSAKKRMPVTLWAAAAVALLLVVFGWFELSKRDQTVLISTSTANNTMETGLPDGSKVFLNYNSSISYPENFTGDIRSVSLKGEAFFDVKPDASHPFIIRANGTEIKVLGTSFNVKAYPKTPVRVDVSTGKVLVRKDKSEINLIKGQSAEVVGDTVRSTMADVNLMGYRTQIFDFNATELNQVVSSIRNGYHVDVRLSGDKLSQCRLTIRFEREPLDATLSVIAETLSLKIRKEGKTYWLDGPGCP